MLEVCLNTNISFFNNYYDLRQKTNPVKNLRVRSEISWHFEEGNVTQITAGLGWQNHTVAGYVRILTE